MPTFPRRHVLKLGGLALGGLGAARIIGMDEAAASPPAADPQGPSSEIMLLSGTGKDDTVDWQFKCTSGARSGEWTTIPVPSNWEPQGFGTYTYGKLSPGEQGQYKYTFTPPAHWRDRKVFLVFEGSMTDTEVWVNGTSAGPLHQGAFYRFGYDVTGLLRLGEANLLEVAVSKDSSNSSINGAERQADYWVFGGIYRPVYLEARPPEYIDRVAVNARADGSFTADVCLSGITEATTVTARILGSPARPFSVPVSAGLDKVTLTTNLSDPRTWTAETPNLYTLDVRLMDGHREIHRVRQKFGFRTVEVRPGDGIYVNGTKVMLRGVCRHTFWPDSGRTSSPELSKADILLMKQMNMNAVLMSHYPPDQHFLDSADELGIYVLDELAGWQHAYDTDTAHRLVQEMIVRDVNHPSIILWCNGNEGGWNRAVDGDFALYDPQGRDVIHPGGAGFGNSADRTFGNILDKHYPTYSQTQDYLNGSTIYMPTEFLHSLYDGGAGAGLNDHWKLMMSSPLTVGGFLWDFADGGIVRTDKGGAIDTNGNSDPDGVLGPYRQKEGSFFTIKEIWSPIQAVEPSAFPVGFDGTVQIVNHYNFTDADQCRFTWKLLEFAGGPFDRHAENRVLNSGTARPSGHIPPGGTGTLRLDLPGNWSQADALSLTVADPDGHELYTWVWTITNAAGHRARIVTPGRGRATAAEDGTTITMSAAGTDIVISKSTGLLAGVRRNGKTISLANGPAPAVGTASLTSLTHGPDGAAHVVTAGYTGGLTSCTWRLLPSGWLELDYGYQVTGAQDFFGVNFDYPETAVRDITWLGHGPYRVYKNRLRGVTTGIWNKAYNDTITGASLWEYPEFKGYHASTYWARLETTEGEIAVVADDEDMFLRLFTPKNPPNPVTAVVPYPSGDISFLEAIPAIGNKFQHATDTGPEGQPNMATGDYRRTVYLAFAT